MRIAMNIVNRSTSGGDSLEAGLLCDALRDRGIDANLAETLGDWTEADVIHLVNSADPGLLSRVHGRVRRVGVPYVYSPLHHDAIWMSRYIARRVHLPATVECAWHVYNTVSCPSIWPLSASRVRRVVAEGASRTIVHTQMERASVGLDVPGVPLPQVVLPSVSSLFANAEPRRRDIDILVVGRIEPLKNQITVIRALRGLGRPRLVFIGDTPPQHGGYFQQLVEEAARSAGTVEFLGRMTPQDLADMYQRARVVVVPSYFETLSLVALEATVSGCRVVLSNATGASELIDGAPRFDPWDVGRLNSILRDELTSANPALELRFDWSYARQAADLELIYREVAKR